jgi:pyruvyl transferase EpsI
MRAVYRRVKLVPDMVLSLSQLSHSARNGCLLVLRKDREKTIADTVVMEIIKICSSLFDVVNKTDMVVPYGVMPKNRETELARKWEEFQKAELVITDRLHGMIFAAITETPCIVLDSMSPKVRGCYEWIKELNYIKFADSAKDIPILYEQIKNKTPRYDNLKYLKLMRPLEEELLMLKNGSA